MSCAKRSHHGARAAGLEEADCGSIHVIDWGHIDDNVVRYGAQSWAAALKKWMAEAPAL